MKPIEQLKRGCFALLAWHNKTACGRHVYTPSSESQREWERRKSGREGRPQKGAGKRERGRNDDKRIYSEVKEKRWDKESRLKETEEESNK